MRSPHSNVRCIFCEKPFLFLLCSRGVFFPPNVASEKGRSAGNNVTIVLASEQRGQKGIYKRHINI